MDFDKATLSSYTMLIIAPVCVYFGFSEAFQSMLVGVIVGLILLAGQLYNEKHNSTVVSDKGFLFKLFGNKKEEEECVEEEGGC